MVKKIWYPGSAYASKEWASYLQKTFKGTWFYSDNLDFEEWNHLNGIRIKADTFGGLPNELLNEKIDVLIISHHPDLKCAKNVIDSGILNIVKPYIFIYDPGPQNDEFSSHLENIVIFQSLGYELYKNNIKLPDLEHQYCEFRNYANRRTQGI